MAKKKVAKVKKTVKVTNKPTEYDILVLKLILDATKLRGMQA